MRLLVKFSAIFALVFGIGVAIIGALTYKMLEEGAHTQVLAQAELMMSGALRGLFAVAENYPQLKANENFLKLQNRISELEERIADRREFFNDDVNTYNTRIRQLPEGFLAPLMALQPREFFKVSDEDRKLVEVKLT